MQQISHIQTECGARNQEFACNFWFCQQMATLNHHRFININIKMSKKLFQTVGGYSESNDAKCKYLHEHVKDVQARGALVESPKTCTLQWLGFPWLLDAFFFIFVNFMYCVIKCELNPSGVCIHFWLLRKSSSEIWKFYSRN